MGFESGSQYVAQAGLELATCSPSAFDPKCRNYRHVPPCLAQLFLEAFSE